MTYPRKHKIWNALYKGTIAFHTLITVYVIVVFLLATTNLWTKIPGLRSVSIVIITGIFISQVINKFDCLLTEFQNHLANRLGEEKIERFSGYLLKSLGINIRQRIIDIFHVITMA